MAWITPIPPSARSPYERYQVGYQDGKRQRSAGIFATKRRALAPTFEDVSLGDLDASTVGAWKAAMVAEGLAARTVNTYLSLLGTILNAAVDDEYLARSPLLRKSGAGRPAATRNQPVRQREVWLTRKQLDRLAEAIDVRYQALVLVAALTGMRWGELAALRWDDLRLDAPLHDGAVRGAGRLRIARALSDPRRSGAALTRRPRPRRGSARSPLTRRRSTRSVPIACWSAVAPSRGSSPPRGGLAVMAARCQATISPGSGSARSARPSWPICGRNTTGCAPTTCATSMRPG